MEIKQRKENWLSFYDLKSEVKTMVLIDFDHSHECGARPWPYPENMRKRLDWASNIYQQEMETISWLHDDRIPALRPYTGTELFARAFGSKVHYPGDNMPFALPMIRNSRELSMVKEPDIFSSALGEAFELARQLIQRNGKDAVIQLPDIQSPLDIAALIWEKADFLSSMLEDPSAVKELIAMTNRTLIRFLDAWFEEFGTEYIAHFPDYYMSGGITLSEDEVGEFSPDMFEEFCLETLNRLSQRYGGIGIHCCAHAKHQWEHFMKIENVRLFNLIQPPKVILNAYKVFEGKAAQMHSWCGDGEPDPGWADHYPSNAHVVLQCSAADKTEAIERCSVLREIAGAR